MMGDQTVDIDEIIGDRRLRVGLRDVAFGAEEAARRDGGEELAVAIHEMGDRNHRRLAFAGSRARMAGQAFVAIEINLVTLDRVRNDRRLLGIIPYFAAPPCCVRAACAAQARDRRPASDPARAEIRRHPAPAIATRRPARRARATRPGPPAGNGGGRSSRFSHQRQADGAFFEIGLQRNRIGRVQRHLVDQLALIEPRHKDHARAASCCAPWFLLACGYSRAATRP